MDRSAILNLIYAAIDEVNPTLPPDRRVDKSPETQLFGRGSRLDSLGLVNLVVATEARLAESGLAVALADERAMSQKQSPFRTVETLCDYIALTLQEGELG
jgi:D-alanine--poly(phosphoribitol) ligase subunit 2